MAYQTSQTRMVLAYNNKVTQDFVSTVTTTNITADLGFPATNLAYDDPAMKLKVSTTNANNRVIEITFSTAQTFNCGGIANHNLMSQGYETIDFAYWNGSSFTSLGGPQDISAYADDPNFILRWTAPGSPSTRWQITLGKASGTRPAFYLGLVFFGTFYEVETGPNDGGAFYTEEWQSDRLVAMGGTAYERPVANREEETAELSWDRISTTMATVLRVIRKTNRGKVVVVIMPHDVTTALPGATQHLFGRITGRTTSPRFGGKHQATINLRGLQ